MPAPVIPYSAKADAVSRFYDTEGHFCSTTRSVVNNEVNKNNTIAMACIMLYYINIIP